MPRFWLKNILQSFDASSPQAFGIHAKTQNYIKITLFNMECDYINLTSNVMFMSNSTLTQKEKPTR